MSERSRLLKKVLDTWEHSDEGRGYLNWLLLPEAANLDGGDVLREAVLDVVEDDDQLHKLKCMKAENALGKICADLPPEAAGVLREGTDGVFEAFARINEGVRKKVETYRELRRLLNRDRLETLDLIARMLRAREPDEIQALFKNFGVMEELAAKVQALSRTSVEPVDAEAEWRDRANDNEVFERWLQTAHKAGEGWFDYASEELDRYYSHQIVARLEKVVERAASLEPVKLQVTDASVRKLFSSSHEAFLYGFNAASIALCRSLVEHALKDKLCVSPRERMGLGSLIERADGQKLLEGADLESARVIQRAGDDVMHKFELLRRTAQQVLDCTRIVLNRVYGNSAQTRTSS